MREILFRGKRLDNGEWVYGYLFSSGVKAYICQEVYELYLYDGALCLGGFIEVDQATVGQYTGQADKNGKRIFDGDKCRVTRFAILAYGHIIFLHGAFLFDEFKTKNILRLCDLEINNFDIEVIGNIHDNPELLK